MSLTNPQKKKSKGVRSGEQVAPGTEPPILSNDQETPCPERHEHKGRSKVVHVQTGKLFLQKYDAKQCPPS
jgi:hypothetical protein